MVANSSYRPSDRRFGQADYWMDGPNGNWTCAHILARNQSLMVRHERSKRRCPPFGQARKHRLPSATGRSYWQRHTQTKARVPKNEERTGSANHPDVVLIGGGFAGLMTAIRLAEMEPAADILLLEANFVGFGASGRNAGLLSPLAAPVWLVSSNSNPEHAWAFRASQSTNPSSCKMASNECS